MITTGLYIVIVSPRKFYVLAGCNCTDLKTNVWEVHEVSIFLPPGRFCKMRIEYIPYVSYYSASVYLRLCLAFEGVTQRSICIQEKIYCHCPPTWQHRLGGLDKEETGKPARPFCVLLRCDAVCCDRSVSPKRL
jgi:hypothetical protein